MNKKQADVLRHMIMGSMVTMIITKGPEVAQVALRLQDSWSGIIDTIVVLAVMMVTCVGLERKFGL